MILILDCEQVDFDVEVAIKVCRQAGYCDHALKLAEVDLLCAEAQPFYMLFKMGKN